MPPGVLHICACAQFKTSNKLKLHCSYRRMLCPSPASTQCVSTSSYRGDGSSEALLSSIDRVNLSRLRNVLAGVGNSNTACIELRTPFYPSLPSILPLSPLFLQLQVVEMGIPGWFLVAVSWRESRWQRDAGRSY